MPVTDVELVQRAGRGDADAVRQLLDDVRPMVVRYCRARLGRVGGAFTTADDLAQEVCVAVLQALPGLRPSGRTFLAFVYRIAAHKVFDAGRAEPTKSIEDLPDRERQAIGPEGRGTGPDGQGTGPDGRALRADSPDRLRHLLDRLSATQREMVILRVAVGMSADDVGAALSMTPGAVRLMQHRALIKLRAMAGDVLDEVTR